jgi:hypothetical protein
MQIDSSNEQKEKAAFSRIETRLPDSNATRVRQPKWEKYEPEIVSIDEGIQIRFTLKRT